MKNIGFIFFKIPHAHCQTEMLFAFPNFNFCSIYHINFGTIKAMPKFREYLYRLL